MYGHNGHISQQIAMGNCSSNVVYDDSRVRKFKSQFEALQLKEHDVAQILRISHNVDSANGGDVGISEFLEYVKIFKSAFAERVLSLFDQDGSGELDFRELVFCIWNFCTLDKSTLILFAFHLYDKDKSGILSRYEIERLLGDIYGKGYKTDTITKV